MTECDLSHCLYIATSNSLERLPEPLLSRLRPVYFPPPGPEHAQAIIQGVLGDMARAWGLPRGALTVTPPQIAFLRGRSEEHPSELQSLMRISYAVFCLKKNKKVT